MGVTRFSDFPPEAKRLPSVGSYVNLDLERIVALNPDLCFATKDGNPKAVVSRLEALNIPVYVVDPRNLDGVMDSLIKIGEILNARQKAVDIVKEMRRRIRHISSRVSGASHRPLFFSDRHHPHHFSGFAHIYP
ncbi:MAG: ABC transporter substrate-binding protein [Deltaproteobacteria bacterium]|nr:ABC transporter substrate-binding protein [Deltaproteobacteria bacterium]